MKEVIAFGSLWPNAYTASILKAPSVFMTATCNYEQFDVLICRGL